MSGKLHLIHWNYFSFYNIYNIYNIAFFLYEPFFDLFYFSLKFFWNGYLKNCFKK